MAKMVYKNSVISDTVGAMSGATDGSSGSMGLVPQPLSSDRNKVLKGDGTWYSVTDSIAPAEDGDEFVNPYAIGEQFYHDCVLYQAKVAIPAETAWSSLVLDTDYEAADSISTQIKKMRALLQS